LWLNVVPIKDEEVAEVASSVQGMTVRWTQVPSNLPVLGVLFESSLKEVSFSMETVLAAENSVSLCEGGTRLDHWRSDKA
jgi:hypothetical protein